MQLRNDHRGHGHQQGYRRAARPHSALSPGTAPACNRPAFPAPADPPAACPSTPTAQPSSRPNPATEPAEESPSQPATPYSAPGTLLAARPSPPATCPTTARSARTPARPSACRPAAATDTPQFPAPSPAASTIQYQQSHPPLGMPGVPWASPPTFQYLKPSLRRYVVLPRRNSRAANDRPVRGHPQSPQALTPFGSRAKPQHAPATAVVLGRLSVVRGVAGGSSFVHRRCSTRSYDWIAPAGTQLM